MTADEIADRLAAKRSGPKSWMACCPAHEDRSPSLSISEGDNGGILLHCHAACTLADVLAALGLTTADLAPPKDSSNGHADISYRYTDEAGALLYEVVRKPGKQFRQRRPDGAGGWIWKRADRLVLYRLPKVLKAVANGEVLFIVEGEKDADRVIAEGRVATTNPMGAGKWDKIAEHARQVLAGADVKVIQDNDDPGRRHAAAVVAAIRNVVGSVELLRPVDGCKDASDHLAAGHTLEDLRPVTDAPPDEGDSDERTPSTWAPVDLTDALAGVDIPPPTMMARADGVHLLYAGRTHGFAGESESCKSWAALVVAANLIGAGADVLWIDFEDDDRGTVARLRSLMVPVGTIAAHFVYVRPEEPLSAKNDAVTFAAVDFAALLKARTWSLIVIDGVTVSMSAEGMDINSNQDIARWSTMLPKRCADTGAAVVMIDHVTKSTDGRGRYAIGGQHKLAAITGAQYVFDVEVPFGRATHSERTGIMRVTVTKDRPGHVRNHAIDGVVARLNLTSYPDGGVAIALVAPDASQLDLKLAADIAAHLTIYPGSSKKKIEEGVSAKAERVRDILPKMVEAGWIVVEVKGQSHLHTLTELGAEYLR